MVMVTVTVMSSGCEEGFGKLPTIHVPGTGVRSSMTTDEPASLWDLWAGQSL